MEPSKALCAPVWGRIQCNALVWCSGARHLHDYFGLKVVFQMVCTYLWAIC